MVATTVKEMVESEVGSVRLSVEVRWRRIGRITRDNKGDLAFPETTRETAVYRIHLCGKGRTKCYVGETVELRRRFRHYRKPGRLQKTNIRIHKALQEHLTTGGSVKVDVATGSMVMPVGHDIIQVNLADNAQRRLVENAALVMETAGGMDMLNL